MDRPLVEESPVDKRMANHETKYGASTIQNMYICMYIYYIYIYIYLYIYILYIFVYMYVYMFIDV